MTRLIPLFAILAIAYPSLAQDKSFSGTIHLIEGGIITVVGPNPIEGRQPNIVEPKFRITAKTEITLDGKPAKHTDLKNDGMTVKLTYNGLFNVQKLDATSRVVVPPPPQEIHPTTLRVGEAGRLASADSTFKIEYKVLHIFDKKTMLVEAWHHSARSLNRGKDFIFRGEDTSKLADGDEAEIGGAKVKVVGTMKDHFGSTKKVVEIQR